MKISSLNFYNAYSSINKVNSDPIVQKQAVPFESEGFCSNIPASAIRVNFQPQISFKASKVQDDLRYIIISPDYYNSVRDYRNQLGKSRKLRHLKVYNWNKVIAHKKRYRQVPPRISLKAGKFVPCAVEGPVTDETVLIYLDVLTRKRLYTKGKAPNMFLIGCNTHAAIYAEQALKIFDKAVEEIRNGASIEQVVKRLDPENKLKWNAKRTKHLAELIRTTADPLVYISAPINDLLILLEKKKIKINEVLFIGTGGLMGYLKDLNQGYNTVDELLQQKIDKMIKDIKNSQANVSLFLKNQEYTNNAIDIAKALKKIVEERGYKNVAEACTELPVFFQSLDALSQKAKKMLKETASSGVIDAKKLAECDFSILKKAGINPAEAVREVIVQQLRKI